MLHVLSATENEVDATAAGMIAHLIQQGEPPQQQQEAAVAELQEQQLTAAGGIASWSSAMQARKVVGIHQGKGRVADHGFKNPKWINGRLWVYEDGTCGFVFELGSGNLAVHHLVDLERLDADL